MRLSKPKKIAAVCAGAALLSAALLASFALSKKRTAELRTRDWIVKNLEQKFQSDVELADFRVKVFPKMQVIGKGLMLRYWPTPEAPPLIRIERFSFELGFLGIFRTPHRLRECTSSGWSSPSPRAGSGRPPAAGRSIARRFLRWWSGRSSAIRPRS